jgi:signal peptidase complex subunit 1
MNESHRSTWRHQKTGIMDYEGQKLAEILFYWIILSFGAVGWVIGYIQQDFVVVFYAWLVGVTLSVIVSPRKQ